MAHDLAASIRARLLNIAKAEQTDFNSVLVRYALERKTALFSMRPAYVWKRFAKTQAMPVRG
jgi:hypothetical protein